MKQLRRMKFYLWGALMMGLLISSNTQAEALLYLVDEAEREELEEQGIEVLQIEDQDGLEDLLEERDPPSPSTQWERLSEKAYLDQVKLVQTLESFLISEFNPVDYVDNANFVAHLDLIVDLVFKAPTERDYIQRLYILNQFYRNNLDEYDRFDALDTELRRKNLKIETRRRQIREVIIGATSLTGAALGAYLTFKVTQRAIPIVADEKVLSLVMKWGGRGLFIVAGTSFGAALGAYAGFLGSDYLLSRQFEYFDPLDEDEDLTDLLEIIDSH